MKFTTRLMLSFAAPAILFVACLGGAIWSLTDTKAQFGGYIERDQAMANSVREMYAQGLQMGQALRNIILDPANPKAFQNLETARGDFSNALNDTTRLSEGTAVASAVGEIAALRQKQAEAQDKVLAVVKTDSEEARRLLNEQETPAWRALKGKLLELRDASGQQATARYESVARNATRTSMVVEGLAVVAVLVAAWLGWMARRTMRRELGGEPDEAKEALARIAQGDLTRDVRAHAKDTTSLMASVGVMQMAMRQLIHQVQQASANIQVASTEVAVGNQDLSQRTEQAASNLEETAASMEQLTATVRQSADAARQANQLASSAAETAQRGGSVVSQVVSTMSEINQSSQKISHIIGVIDGIAFQTNILALNAAVEAARAGEQGRGFAVVASEVRSLAQRSAEAAKEIKGLINTSVEKVENGTRLVDEAGSTMTEIVGSVQRVSDIIGEITAAAGEQSDGIGQVNVAVNQLDQMTQQNAALVEESSAAAESLKDQAHRLSEVIRIFRIDGAAVDVLDRAPVRATSPASAPARMAPAVKAVAKPAPVKQLKAPVAAPANTASPAPKAATSYTPATSSSSSDEGDWESF